MRTLDSLNINVNANSSTVRAHVNPSRGGSISPTSQRVTNGNNARVNVTPNTGWSVTSWSTGGGVAFRSGSGNSYTSGSVTSNGTITANMTQDRYTLTVNASGSGSAGASVSNPITYGTTVTVTATPDFGNSFVNWTGRTSGMSTSTGNNSSFIMTGNRSITANFVPNRYTPTINTSGSGSAGASVSNPITHGTTVTVTAIPDSGHAFGSWTGSTRGVSTTTGTSSSFTMTENRAITAHFGPISKTPMTVEITALPPVEYSSFLYTSTPDLKIVVTDPRVLRGKTIELQIGRQFGRAVGSSDWESVTIYGISDDSTLMFSLADHASKGWTRSGNTFTKTFNGSSIATVTSLGKWYST